ncbi:MAG: ribosome maturation factor RimM [Acidimicrobiia bacterium]
MSSSTDSPQAADDLVLVGRLGRAHGLRGFLVLISDSDNDARFERGSELVLGSGNALTIRDVLTIPNGRALAFVGYDDRTIAEVLRGEELYVVAATRRPLAPDEFWPDELIGLDVRNTAGSTVGRVEAIDDTSAQTRLIVATLSGQFMVPLVTALVPEVSMAGGYLVVADLPGLFDDQTG